MASAPGADAHQSVDKPVDGTSSAPVQHQLNSSCTSSILVREVPRAGRQDGARHSSATSALSLIDPRVLSKWRLMPVLNCHDSKNSLLTHEALSDLPGLKWVLIFSQTQSSSGNLKAARGRWMPVQVKL